MKTTKEQLDELIGEKVQIQTFGMWLSGKLRHRGGEGYFAATESGIANFVPMHVYEIRRSGRIPVIFLKNPQRMIAEAIRGAMRDEGSATIEKDNEPKGKNTMKIPEKHHKAFGSYNEDCKRHDEPWRLWEMRRDSLGDWEQLRDYPCWNEHCDYRRKPATVTICGIELPEPVREPLEMGEEYWVVGLGFSRPGRCEWDGDHVDQKLLQQGRIRRSAEDARAWREFLVGLMSGRIGT